ncbi:hypothetical protein [Rhodanobacter sp. DHB23]|uniref:hypothetical protein n=1 Tax=Rhodanobacter sp. DHB23 TaxID=2775923 RepID=UPI0017831112|nr:hypothetical protein [Rhodanobacter sp. DHB23]MBD8871689.1 hypothetical protein [Rhodanobacter sp. DHB23]
MRIPLDTIGEIRNSEKAEHRVLVSGDTESTDGLFIYEWWVGSNGPNANNAFDSWVADRQELQQFFKEAGWDVAWPA